MTEETNKIVDSIEKDNNELEYRINISIDLFWKIAPESTLEKMRQEKLKFILNYNAEAFFRDKQNCAKFMNMIANIKT